MGEGGCERPCLWKAVVGQDLTESGVVGQDMTESGVPPEHAALFLVVFKRNKRGGPFF